MDLFDLPLFGGKFACFQPRGRKISRIVCILLFDGWSNAWGPTAQWALPRDVSNHCHIILKYGHQSRGRKPLWFNNHWLSHPDFHDMISNSWLSSSNVGWKDFILLGKFISLKIALKI